MRMMWHVKLEGRTGILMHRDNIEHGGLMKKWEQDPKNKGDSVSGDDRSPAYRWMGALYHDGTHIALPSDIVMATILNGGARVKVPNQGMKTFKSQTQSGIVPMTAFWPITVPGKGLIKMSDVNKLLTVKDFDEHLARVAKLGFVLDVRPGKVKNNRHVRVRPYFAQWSAEGQLLVTDDQIKPDVFRLILNEAGVYSGVCDWRPSAPKRPGPFGTFTSTITETSL